MPKFILTAQMKLAAPGSANIQAIVNTINRQLNGIKANVNINVTNVQKQLNSLNTQFKNTSKSVKQTTNDIEKFGEQSALAIRRYGAFTLATGGFIKLTQAISSGVDEAIKFDRELVRVAQVTGQSLKSLTGLSKEITRLSTQYGVASTEILKASVTLSQAGLATKDVKTALEALAKTGISATFGDIQNTTEATIAIMQQFGVQAKDLEKTLSSVNKVSAAFAVESDDIAVAVRRAGGAFQAAGGNLNEFIALFTSVRQTTRESAESIATGFRTIFTRLQRLKTQDFFAGFGVQLRDFEGNFVGPYKAIEQISKALKDIKGTDPRFSQIVEELGGFRQVSKVVPLLQQFAVSEKALNVAIRGGNSLTEDAAIAQEALAVKLQKVKEEFADLIRTLTNNKVFKQLAIGALELASSLIKLTKSIEPLIPVLSTFGAVAIGGQAAAFTRGFKRKIFGFSQGGMVPGSGNRDNVPALLTPGEFVLNKKAVSKLGPDQLRGLNKYADAGPVRELGKPQIANLLRMNKREINETNIVELRRQAQDKLDARKQRKADEKAALRKGVVDLGPQPYSIITPRQQGVSKLTGPNKVSQIANSVRTPNGKQLAIQGFAKLGLNPETLVDYSIPTYGFRDGVSDKFFKFASKGLKFVISKFVRDIIPEGSKLDPEKTPPLSALLSTSAIGSIRGSLFEGIVRRASNSLIDTTGPRNDAIFDFDGKGKSFKNLDSILAPGIQFPADAKAGDLNDAKLNVLAKAARSGNIIRRFAQGGFVSGSGNADNVPSLLTPGEFVVNKKSAQSIGYSTLNKMNKYASGGKVSSFATAGTKTPINLSSAASNTFSNPIGAFAIVGILQSFTSNLSDADSAVSNITSSLGQLALRFVAFSNIIQSFRTGSFGSAIVGQRTDRFNTTSKRQASFSKNFDPLTIAALASQPGGTNAILARRQDRIDKSNALRARGNRFGTTFKTNLGANLALGGGVAAGVIGEGVSSFANSIIKTGQSATGLAGLGGALSGAGTGAAIGAAFGPLGVAVGAVTGGLYGLVTATSEASKELENVKFEQKFDKFSRELEEFGKGRVTASGISSGTISFLSSALGRFGSGNADARRDVVSQIRGSEQVLEKYFQDIAKSSGSLEQFNKVTGDSLLQFAVIAGIPFKSLQDSILKSIEAEKKQVGQIEALNAIRDKEFKSIEQLVLLTAAFQAAAEDVDKFSDRVNSIFDILSGNVLPDVSKASDVFEKAARGEVFNTTSVRNKALGITGAANIDPGLVDELESTTLLLNKLPSIIQEFNRRAAGEGIDREGAEDFIKNIASNFGIKNTNTLSNLGAVVNEQLGPSVDEQKFVRLAENAFEAADKMRPKLDGIVKIFGTAQQHLTEKEKALDNAFKKLVDLENRKIDIEIENLSRSQEFGEQIREFRGRPTSFSAGLGLLGARAGLPINGNPFGRNLIGELSGRQRNAAALQGQLAGTNDIRAREQIIASLAEEQVAIDKLNKAIGILAKDTTALSHGFKELEQEEQKRQFKGNLVNTAVFGGTEERRGLSQTIADVFRVIQAKNNINVIPFENRRGVEDFLRTAGDTKISGQTGKERLEAIVRNEVSRADKIFNFGPAGSEALVQSTLQGGLTQKQEALIAEMDRFVKGQNQLNTDIGTTFSTGAKSIEEAIVNANDVFLKRLESIFTQNEANKTAGEIDTNKGRLDELAKFIGGTSNVAKRLGVNPNNTAELQAAIAKEIELNTKKLTSANALTAIGGQNNVDNLLNSNAKTAGITDLDKILSSKDSGLLIDIVKNQFGPILDALNTQDREKILGQLNEGTNGGQISGRRVSNILKGATGIVSLQSGGLNAGTIQSNLSTLTGTQRGLNRFGSVGNAQSEANKLTTSTNRLVETNRVNNDRLKTLTDAIIKATPKQEEVKPPQPVTPIKTDEPLNIKGRGLVPGGGILPKVDNAGSFSIVARQRIKDERTLAEKGIGVKRESDEDRAARIQAVRDNGRFANLTPAEIESTNFTANPELALESIQERKRIERNRRRNRITALNGGIARGSGAINRRDVGATEDPLFKAQREMETANRLGGVSGLPYEFQTLDPMEQGRRRAEEAMLKQEENKMDWEYRWAKRNAEIRTNNTRSVNSGAGVTSKYNSGAYGSVRYPTMSESERDAIIAETKKRLEEKIPKYASGTGAVPNTGLAVVHKGEGVIPSEPWRKIISLLESNSANATSNINSSSQAFGDAIQKLDAAISRAASTLSSIRIPEQITLTGNHRVEVIINGAEVFNKMKPEFTELVLTAVQKSFKYFIADNNLPYKQPSIAIDTKTLKTK